MFQSKFFKCAVKILCLVGIICFLSCLAWRNIQLDQSPLIEPTITYTTVSDTITTPLNFTPSSRQVIGAISQYVDVPEGGLDWKILAQTKAVTYSFRDQEGMERSGVKPEFTKAVQALDGKNITIQGYMFPLGAEEKQSVFLFGPFPVSCPFHYHVGPSLVIEAYVAEEIEFQWSPITVTGRLELVPHDDDYNVFYRLQEVELEK